MFERYIKTVLNDVLKTAYPDNKDVSAFNVKIIPAERKSLHGKYTFNDYTITIFNLSRDTNFIISTAIHELAHHVNFIINNKRNHGSEFYDCFKKLLYAGITIGAVDYNKLREVQDVRDISVFEKKFGIPTVKYNKSKNTKKELRILNVKGTYTDKELLKENKFYYEPISGEWYKIVNNSQLETEINKLKDVNPKIIIKHFDYYKMPINAVYYFIVDSSYERKNILKDRKYRYENTKLKNKWVKKVDADKFYEEERFLIINRFEYKVKNNLNFFQKKG